MEVSGINKLKYKSSADSNVGWIGNIPKHWELRKLKYIFSEKKIVHNPELNCGSISFGKVVTKDDSSIPLSTKASYQEVLQGEFLINPLNLNYDLKSLRIALSEIDVVVSSGYIVIQNHLSISKSFFKWLLHRYDVAYMKLLGSGVRQTINFNHISNSLLPFPPKPEQTAIANFLDDKTAKIDQAIAQKERMIELLQERKQIIIQNAVTKGLNPNVQLKDSGVEWIGEIPEHWEVRRAKYIFYESDERSLDGSEELLSVSHMTGITARSEKDVNMFRAEDYSGSKICRKGDLVYNIMWAWMGALGVSHEHGIVSPSYAVYRPLKNISFNKWYLEELLKNKNYVTHYNQVSTGLHSSRLRFYSRMFFDMEMGFPDITEQNRIEEEVKIIVDKIDASIQKSTLQIAKLKEYKTTLIDHAVTGKIKVD